MKSPAKILMHINYAEQGSFLTEAFTFARSCGFDGVEIRRKTPETAKSPSAYLDTVEEAFETAGLECAILGGPPINLMAPERSLREAELEEAIAFYEAARRRLPVLAINFMTGAVCDPQAAFHDWSKHGSAHGTETQWQQALEGGKVLAAYLEKSGLHAGIESHMRHLHDTMDSTLRLVRGIGSSHVGITFDAGNLLMMSETPTLAELVNGMASETKIVHLKNHFRTFGGEISTARLKDGDINNRQFLNSLRASGYNGPWVLEAPSPGDRLAWASEDYQYIRNLLNV